MNQLAGSAVDECAAVYDDDKVVVAVVSDSEGEDDNSSYYSSCDGVEGNTEIKLPSEVWGMVLDCKLRSVVLISIVLLSFLYLTRTSHFISKDLPYESVISFALTSHSNLYDALPFVSALHIYKSSELRIGLVSKQLRDVRSISIYNLFRKFDGGDGVFNEDIARRSVPFLSRFSHLENVYFWGMGMDALSSRNELSLVLSDEGVTNVNFLIGNLCAHFDSGALPSNLSIYGLSCPKKTAIGTSEDCRVCERICKKFPLERVYNIDLCLPIDDGKEIIESRHGGKEYLLSDTWFLRLLGNTIVGRISEGIVVLKYHPEVLDEMKSFIESSQVNVSELKREDVHGAIMKGNNNILYPVFLSEESFDHLKKIGLDISDDLLDHMAIRVENIPRWANNMIEENSFLRGSIVQINNLLSLEFKEGPPTQQVVDSGVLPKIVELLQRDEDHNIQHKAAEILTNVSAGKTKHTSAVVKSGAIPHLVNLLGSPHSNVTESAAWTLGNIAGNGPHKRDLVLQAGAVQPLLRLFDQTSELKFVRVYIWVLQNFCRVWHKPRRCLPDFNLLNQSIPTLSNLVYHSDDEVVTDACWALRYLSDGPNRQIQAVLDVLNDTGVRRLIELLSHSETSVQMPALRTVGNIAEGNDSQIQIVVKNGALPVLLTLLSSANDSTVKEACCTISNITAGTEDQIQAVFDSGIIPVLIRILSHERSGVRKWAVWVVANATKGGSVKQVKLLVNGGCIPRLLDLLRSEESEAIIYNALLGLENVS